MATLLSIAYASAVNGIAYDVVSYERTPHGADPADPLNPYVVAAEQVEVSGGVLTVKDGNDSNWSLAGVSFGSFGPETDGFWDATQGCAEAVYLFTTGALDDVSIGPLMFVQKTELAVIPHPLVLQLEEGSGDQWTLRLLARGWDADIEDDSVTFDRSELEGQQVRVRVEWQCGTVIGSPSDVTADGFIKVYWNSDLILNLTNVDLIISDDQDEVNWANGFAIGYSGLMGEVASVRLSNNLCKSSRNLFSGDTNRILGSDSVAVGAHGRLVGNRSVLENLDGVTRTETEDGAHILNGRLLWNQLPASRLLGRGDTGTREVQEIELGDGLEMIGTTLHATGGGSPGGGSPGSPTDEETEWIIKPSDTTRNNTAVLANDPDLVFAAPDATATYFFEMFLIFVGNSTTADVQIGWSYPSGAFIWWGPELHGTSNFWSPVASGTTPLGMNIESTVIAIGSPTGGVFHLCHFTGYFITNGTSGNFALQWAQNVATAVNTILKARSLMRVRRIL